MRETLQVSAFRCGSGEPRLQSFKAFLEQIIAAGEEIGHYRAPDRLVGWAIFLREVRAELPNGDLELWCEGVDGSVWYWRFSSVEWNGIEPGRWGGLRGAKNTPNARGALVDRVGQTESAVAA